MPWSMSSIMSKEWTVSVPESINDHFNIVLQREKGMPQFIKVELEFSYPTASSANNVPIQCLVICCDLNPIVKIYY